jgi:hypothetical protein
MGTLAHNVVKFAGRGRRVPAAPAGIAPPANLPADPPHFVCDSAAHRVYRLDARGRVVSTFGEPGRGPGQFDTPSNVTLVLPMFEGEDIAGCSQAALIAVADRMNHRVQVFELEGQFVAALGEFSEAAAERPGRDGWPYFRLSPQPMVTEHVRLRWEAPWLHIVDAHGHTTRIDLAYAMLPAFDAWLAAATTPTLVSAHHHFRFCARHTEAMAVPLLQLETALGEVLLRAGDIDAVTRVWSLSWPAGLTPELIEAEAGRRERAATAAAFHLGSANRVARLRTALRMSAPVRTPAITLVHDASAQEAASTVRETPAGSERKCVGE